MAEGFAGGLAQGITQGTQLAGADAERKFNALMAQKQSERADQELGMRQTAADREAATAALSATEAQRADLTNRIRFAAPEELDGLGSQLQAINAKRQEAYKALNGADMTQWAAKSEKTANDLDKGNTTIKDHSPQEISDMIAYHSKRPASDFIDTPDQKSPVGQALDQYHAGVENLPKDGGKQLLGAVNSLYGHELQGLIGQYGHDGSEVTAAEFAPPVPHPGDPTGQHVLMTAKITTKDANGRVGEQYVPILDDHGQILAHPDDRSDATVKNFNLGDLFDHIGATESLYQAANKIPEVRKAIVEHAVNGGDEDQQKRIQLLHQLGHDPAEWMPKQKVTNNGAVTYTEDQFQNQYDAKSIPKAIDPAAAAKDAADTELTKQKIYNLKHGLTEEGAPRVSKDAGGVGDFGGKVGDLAASFALQGVTLPAGFRSKQQQLGLAKGLLARYPDKPTDEIATMVKNGQIDLKAVTKETQVAANIAGKVNAASNELEALIPLIKKAAMDVPKKEFVPYNKLVQMGENYFSNKKLARLQTLLINASNNYDVISGRGGTDKDKRENARKLFDSSPDNDALFTKLDTISDEARIAKSGAQKATRAESLDSSSESAPATDVPNKSSASKGTVAAADVPAYAAKHGISEAAARKAINDLGYEIQ